MPWWGWVLIAVYGLVGLGVGFVVLDEHIKAEGKAALDDDLGCGLLLVVVIWPSIVLACLLKKFMG